MPPTAPPVAPPPPPVPSGFGGLQLSSKAKRFGEYLLEILLFIVTLGIGWIIWSLIVWGRGQTPAKQVLGMRVIRPATAETATWGRMALREIVGRLLLGFIPFYTLVGAIFVLIDDRNQALWDKVADTVVVDIRANGPAVLEAQPER
jgi:uncharacterized RDD family membrane protein YckC